MTGWTRRSALAGIGAASATPLPGATRNVGPFIDSLSFLPDDLADITRAGPGAMIADVSEVEEVPMRREHHAICAASASTMPRSTRQ